MQQNIYLGAVAKYGPGSIRHAGGKCIHVLNGGHAKPKDETQLVLYDGCGQNRLEFVFANGLIKLTKYNMCVKLKGGATSSGTKVCFFYQLLPQFIEFTENLSLQWFCSIPSPVFSTKSLRKIFSTIYLLTITSLSYIHALFHYWWAAVKWLWAIRWLPTGNYWFQKFDWCSTRVESIKLQETNQFFWVHFRRLQLRLSMLQKQPPKVIYKKSVLKNFAMLTGKQLCWSLFFNKVAGFRNRWETPTQVFSCECTKIIKNTYFEEHLQTAASDALLFRNQYQKLTQICSSKLLKTNVL